MKDKNLNILSPRTSNPLLYVIYNWKCDVTKFRIPPIVTQCHTSSTPSAPFNVWRNLWMPPNSIWNLYITAGRLNKTVSPWYVSSQRIFVMISNIVLSYLDDSCASISVHIQTDIDKCLSFHSMA